MKILIIGAGGFMGRYVASEATARGHEVHRADRQSGDDKTHSVDLLDKSSIAKLLTEVKPEIIINCAGVVENSEKAKLNLEFTSNLLQEVILSGLTLKRIIILGSAAEYGVVGNLDAVNEDTPLKPTNLYGQNKMAETTLASKLTKQHGLPLTIVRPFNPIGRGMHPRLLISSLISQLEQIRSGEKAEIEINRLESARDYIHIKDIATAIVMVATATPRELVYNIGSGESTTNRQLLDILFEIFQFSTKPPVVETSTEVEPLYAARADITRLKQEFGWAPKYTIKEAIMEAASDSE